MFKKLREPKQYHRLYVRIVTKIEQEGMFRFVKSEWIEVPEANLGSVKLPNNKILEFKFVPIEEER